MDEPCQSCVDKYGMYDLNSVNSCCFEKCANQTGLDNVWDIVPTPCGQNCMECLKRAKLARGRTLQYQRRIAPPPIFVEGYDNGDNGNGDSDGNGNIYRPYEQAHPWSFYIAFGIGAVVLALVLTIIVIAIFGGQKKRK